MNERAGQELSAEARQLIANARDADDPTAEDEARVKARWLAGIAAGAGVSSLSEAVRAAASTGWSWGMKAAVLAGAAAVAAVGVYLGWPDAESPGAEAPAQPVAAGARRAASPEAASPEAASPEAASPEAVTPPQEVAAVPGPPSSTLRAAEPGPELPLASPTPGEPAPAHLAQAPTAAEGSESEPGSAAPASAEAPAGAAREPPTMRPAAGARQARGAARSKSSSRKSAAPEATAMPAGEAPASAATGQLGEEIARLSEIRGQLQAGSPARALELLSDYRSRFVEPNLAMEADALQVDALCKTGKREAAREAAAAFATRWPSSPLEQRVSSACQ